jgi:hypothetical protein
MSLLELCQWIESTSSSTTIRESALEYPILSALHLLGIAWFGGMVLMSDLRVLGIGLTHEPAGEVWLQFRRWKWLGFVVMLVSGGLLWWAEPVVCYKSLSFWVKLALLLLVGLNALVFRRGAEASPEGGKNAKLAAGVSVALWVALVFAGRGIAFL